MDTFLQTQLGINLALQQIGGLTAVMQGFSFLGTEDFFLIFLSFIYFGFDSTLGARLFVMLLFSAQVNSLLKIAIHLPRPSWIDPSVKAIATESTYGLPSGHAQIAANTWTFVANETKRTWAWVAAIILILLVSLSRLYLGAHFLSDVIGGWLVGVIILMIVWRVEKPVTGWLAKLNLWSQIGVAFSAAVVVALLGIIVRAAVAASPDPAAWAGFAKDARNLDSIISGAGAIFGVSVGLAMMNRFARFDAKGAWWKRVARFAIGVIGVVAIRFGLGAIFPNHPEAIAFIFRFVRYALLLWWLVFVTPWVCLKIKLAERGG